MIRAARTLARAIRSRLRPRGLILAYHRIAESGSDPWRLAVTPRHFREHLEVLRLHARPIRLDALVDGIHTHRIPADAVAITIDDGYADTARVALPLLEAFDSPATVFVTAGYVGATREFWWDELERLLLHPGTLPPTLELPTERGTLYWRLRDAARYSTADADRHRDWSARRPDNPTDRHELCRALYALLQPMASADRERALDALRRWAPGGGSTIRASHRALSEDETHRLAATGLVDVGAHSVTHPQLAALTARAQQREIVDSRTRLEKVTGRTVSAFAYPYGKTKDYTAASVGLTRQAGFTSAYGTVAGSITPASDPWTLPRVSMDDCDGEELERRLAHWRTA